MVELSFHTKIYNIYHPPGPLKWNIMECGKNIEFISFLETNQIPSPTIKQLPTAICYFWAFIAAHCIIKSASYRHSIGNLFRSRSFCYVNREISTSPTRR